VEAVERIDGPQYPADEVRAAKAPQDVRVVCPRCSNVGTVPASFYWGAEGPTMEVCPTCGGRALTEAQLAAVPPWPPLDPVEAHRRSQALDREVYSVILARTVRRARP
jgi:hypothetical protein